MIDVILINAPLILCETEKEKEFYSSHGGDERSYYPLNILYLSSNLIKNGHSVKVMDISAEGKILPDVIKEVGELQPKVVGISAMTTGIQSAVKLAQKLQGGWKVGIGGTHVCIDHTFIDRYPVFDFCVIGEGEITFEKIVGKIKKGNRIEKIYPGATAPVLDDLPFPARHLINPDIYRRKEQNKFEIPAAGMLASRGCPFNCIFCCIPNRHKVRFRSAKNIVDEMEAIYDQCRGRYSFVDDCFTLSRKHTVGLCEEIIRRKLKCKWIASTRSDLLDDRVGELLKQAGCDELYFGVESGADRIRNEVIGKQVTEASVRKAVSICEKNGIMSNLFLMVGFPTETKKELEETLRIGNRVKADAVGIHITRPMPGSKLFDIAESEGKIHRSIIDDFATGKLGKAFREAYPYYVPDGMTLQDLFDAKKRGYRRFYLSLSFIIRRIKVWLKLKGRFKEDLKLFKLIIPVLIRGGTKGQLS